MLRLCGLSPPLAQITIIVPLAKGLNGRDVDTKYTDKHIKFGLKGQPAIVDADVPHGLKNMNLTSYSECRGHGQGADAVPRGKWDVGMGGMGGWGMGDGLDGTG